MYRSLPKIKTFALILTVAFAASAQFNVPLNARKAAMANVPMSDITGLYKHPALITNYTDHVQATWNGGVLATKGMNDMLSIGILANQGMMAPRFAEAAAIRLNGFIPATAPGGAADFTESFNIPHLLLGFDLGAIKLGADIFFEFARYSSNVDDPSAEYRGSINHPGAKLGVMADIGDIALLAKFGIGFPSISGEIAPSGSDKLSSDAGLYIETGAEARIPVSDLDLIVGADFVNSTHRFRVGSTADANEESNSYLSMYVGTEFNFVETAAAALQYNFAWTARKSTAVDQTNSPSTTGPASYRHIFSAGIENSWEDFWKFDTVWLRGGASYTATSSIGGSSGVTDTDYNKPAAHNGVVPVIGLGVSKDFFTLDLSLNMGSWGGLFDGPDVALVTGTIKF